METVAAKPSTVAPSLAGVWEIKDDLNNLYFMNADSDGQYIMSASNALGDSHGIYKMEGQNKFKMKDWSFVYNKENQAEAIQIVDGEVIVYDNSAKLDGFVKVSIRDIKTGKISTFESKCTGIRLID